MPYTRTPCADDDGEAGALRRALQALVARCLQTNELSEVVSNPLLGFGTWALAAGFRSLELPCRYLKVRRLWGFKLQKGLVARVSLIPKP